MVWDIFCVLLVKYYGQIPLLVPRRAILRLLYNNGRRILYIQYHIQIQRLGKYSCLLDPYFKLLLTRILRRLLCDVVDTFVVLLIWFVVDFDLNCYTSGNPPV